MDSSSRNYRANAGEICASSRESYRIRTHGDLEGGMSYFLEGVEWMVRQMVGHPTYSDGDVTVWLCIHAVARVPPRQRLQ